MGPPGTGKTLVIAAAVSHLAASGQRVLLVSSTNIAVDTALREALRILEPGGEGQAVRVGHIDLPELAADGRVRLDRLVESRQAEQQARVDDLAGQLEDLGSAGQRLAEAEKRLGGFDADSYQQAATHVTNRHRHEQVTEALGHAETRLDGARAELLLREQQVLSLACCEAADRETEMHANLAIVDAALAAHQESSPMTLCVPKTSSMSCDQAILGDRATGASLSSDAVPRKIDGVG